MIFATSDPAILALVGSVVVVVVTQFGLVLVGRRNAGAAERASEASERATRAAAEATSGAAMADTAFKNMTVLLERADQSWHDCESRCAEIQLRNAQLAVENGDLHEEIVALRKKYDRLNSRLTTFIRKYGETP